jgi:hypothetical protein
MEASSEYKALYDYTGHNHENIPTLETSTASSLAINLIGGFGASVLSSK